MALRGHEPVLAHIGEVVLANALMLLFVLSDMAAGETLLIIRICVLL